MSSPLEGIRVVDFTRALSGPFATMTLADLGADVVKIEHIKGGDDTRKWGPPFSDGVSTYFLSANRGKRSLALDLKSAEHKELVLRLIDVADVVVENFRPGVMKKLGLDADTLRKRKQDLVVCSISGFGQQSTRPGYDVVVQGMGGIVSLTGPIDGAPFKCATSMADLVAGQNALQGILSALVRRERTGKGAHVDVSMIDGMRAFLVYHASSWLNAGVEPIRMGNHHPSVHPLCAYPSSDGWFNIAVGNDSLWAATCRTIGRVDLIEDERFRSNPDRVRNREALDEILVAVFQQATTNEWELKLGEAGVPVGPIHTVPQALEDAVLVEHPHPQGGKSVRTVPLPFQMDGAARATGRRAPALGEHLDEVVEDWLSEGKKA